MYNLDDNIGFICNDTSEFMILQEILFTYGFHWYNSSKILDIKISQEPVIVYLNLFEYKYLLWTSYNLHLRMYNYMTIYPVNLLIRRYKIEKLSTFNNYL